MGGRVVDQDRLDGVDAGGGEARTAGAVIGDLKQINSASSVGRARDDQQAGASYASPSV